MSDARSLDADRADARQFVVCLFLVVTLPIALVVALANLLAFWMADGSSPSRIAELQHDNPKLAWVGPLDLHAAIKIARLKLDAPEIAVLGASRMGELRSAMFKPYSFYNGTQTAWALERLYTVLDMVTVVRPPKVVIFSLDYAMFASDYEGRNTHLEEKMPLKFDYWSLAFDRTGPQWRWWTRELFYPKLRSSDQFSFFGLPATVPGKSSFIHDGSLRYFADGFEGADLRNSEVHNTKIVLDSVAANSGGRMDPVQVARLRKIADIARQRGVVLVGLQMPLAKIAVDTLDAGNDFVTDGFIYPATNMRLWHEFESDQTRDLFASMGIVFVDLARLPEAANAHAFIDPIHPGEYLTLCSIIEMMKDPRLAALLPAIDLSALEQTKRRAEIKRNYFDVFKDQF